MKILIVEDDEILSELLREYLQQLDHERVQVCSSGHAAVSCFTQPQMESFDCAFVDLKLPDMDGLDLLDFIKNRDPGLPVVMMSGYSQEEAESRFPGEQPTAFIQKPYEIAILREVVRRSVANV